MIFKERNTPHIKLKPFIDYFHLQEESADFPVRLALELFENLESSAKDDEELIFFCMEDIIFAALYATFYEHIFLALKDNKHMGVALMEKFSQSLGERERIIAAQTQDHLAYVQNGGHCDGCKSCANHKDVVDMVPYWQRKDFDFFMNMFLGMHTIQFAFEQYLYDMLPSNMEFSNLLDSGGILALRKHIFNYTEKLLK